jgi:16S rRNA (guanine527-N7)-methyltransferase
MAGRTFGGGLSAGGPSAGGAGKSPGRGPRATGNGPGSREADRGRPPGRARAAEGSWCTDRIRAGLEALEIDAAEWQLKALERYLGELELWNRKRDLVKAEGDALIVRHLLDSLAGLHTVRAELDRGAGRARGTTLPTGSTTPGAGSDTGGAEADAIPPGLFDLGSGGGFPGIPLAVFLPEAAVTLVERSGSKCSFLRSACAVAGLSNVTVEKSDYRNLSRRAGSDRRAGTGRSRATRPGGHATETPHSARSTEGRTAEAAHAEPAPGAHVIVFRALTELDSEKASELGRLLEPGGSIVAYKGRRKNAAREAEAVQRRPGDDTVPFVEVELIPVNVPELGEERTLLVLRSSAGSS